MEKKCMAFLSLKEKIFELLIFLSYVFSESLVFLERRSKMSCAVGPTSIASLDCVN
jgi:hypothetical protein